MSTNGFRPTRRGMIATGVAGVSIGAPMAVAAAEAPRASSLINLSYEQTRGLYVDVNRAFIADQRIRAGKDVRVISEHGASVGQAGLLARGEVSADVVTLAHEPEGAFRRPRNAAPYASTIVFVVRKDNPAGVSDWDQVADSDLTVALAHPASSGGGRWTYLAAWAWAQSQGQSPERTLKALYRRAPILDSNSTAAGISFANRDHGDVLITWEDEARRILTRNRYAGLEIVRPSVSMRAEPFVALAERHVDDRGTRALAESYLAFLYGEHAQSLMAAHGFVPKRGAADDAFAGMQLATIGDFGGWREAEQRHFAPGGTFGRALSA